MRIVPFVRRKRLIQDPIETMISGSGLMSVVAIAREIRAGHYIAPELGAFEYVALVVTRRHVVKLLGPPPSASRDGLQLLVA